MDKNYWYEYYKLHGEDKEISDPSSFAKFILKNFFSERKFNIVELGSGNGCLRKISCYAWINNAVDVRLMGTNWFPFSCLHYLLFATQTFVICLR